MRVIPKINIMNGHCVKQGNCQYSEIISHSPGKVAGMWEGQGASYLHVRDLDGIMAGHIINHEAITKLINHVSIPVEVYGGIHSLKEIENVLQLGAKRVVLELWHTNMKMIQDAVASFGTDSIVMHIEGRRCMQTLHSTPKFSMADMTETIKRAVSLGIHVMECEGVFQDSYSCMLNQEQLDFFLKAAGTKLIISGGISTLKELEYMEHAGAYGVILDDSLYERRIELKQAIELFEKGTDVNGL